MNARALLLALVLLLTGVVVPPGADAQEPCPPGGAATGQVVGQRQVVLLVHGFSSGPQVWSEGTDTARVLGELPGTHVATFDYADRSDRWVTDDAVGPSLARTIQCYATASQGEGGPGTVVLVAHSMGGLAVRCALDEACGGIPGLTTSVGMVVTLGTPSLGSLFQRPGTAGIQNIGGGAISTACRALSATQLGLNELLDGLCDAIRDASTSEAAQAFRQGSPELAALAPWPPGLEVHALAGAARVGRQILFARLPAVSAGDLVVGLDSATDGTVDDPPVELDCGEWVLAGSGGLDVLRVVPGACWHGTEPSSEPFTSAVADLVGSYTAAHRCGDDLSAPEIAAAISQVPVFELDDGTTYPWDTTASGREGRYDRCATLSAVTLHIEGATGSSPMQVMLFHRGAYAGTATEDMFPGVSIDLDASTDDTVELDYFYVRPWDPSNADASGRASARFQWDGAGVVQLDELPDDLVDPTRRTTISLDGFGPFDWGTPLGDAEDALGNPVSLQDLGDGCSQGTIGPAETFSGPVFAVQDGVVAAASVEDDTAETDTGIAVGDPVTAVLEAYPDVVVTSYPSDAGTAQYEVRSGDRVGVFLSSDQVTVDSLYFGIGTSVGEFPCV